VSSDFARRWWVSLNSGAPKVAYNPVLREGKVRWYDQATAGGRNGEIGWWLEKVFLDTGS